VTPGLLRKCTASRQRPYAPHAGHGQAQRRYVHCLRHHNCGSAQRRLAAAMQNTRMPSFRQIPPPLALIVAGTLLGALSWLAASVVSGTFEPYDSSSGLLVNQIVLSAPAVVLASLHRATVPLLLLAGAYVGMNAYAYAFGGSEARAWVALGAVTSLLLLVVPAALMSGAAALRRFRQSHDPPVEPSRLPRQE